MKLTEQDRELLAAVRRGNGHYVAVKSRMHSNPALTYVVRVEDHRWDMKTFKTNKDIRAPQISTHGIEMMMPMSRWYDL